jgi:hypothetical protein
VKLQENRETVPYDYSGACQHLNNKSRPPKPRQRYAGGTLADVYSQYQQTFSEADLIEDIHRPQVMGTYLANVKALP